MDLEERKIDVGHLMKGMYVCRLDRPWTESPFLLQGFAVKTTKDLETVRQYCSFVYVDINKGRAPPPEKVIGAAGGDLARLRNSTRYADTATVQEELPQARKAFDKGAQLASKILRDVRAGQKLSPEDVNEAARPVVASVLRSADAFLWIDSMRERDAYAYSHAINCSALAASFGRHLGFPEEVLINLASGGLLLDVGKVAVNSELLQRRGSLSSAEFTEVKQHVVTGLRILEQSGIKEEGVRDMLIAHHERDNGSGYPDGLKGEQIPLFGRMAAIVDTFDAMTSDRAHQLAVSRYETLQKFYGWRDELFQGELVEQFMQCLGVYPTGSLVELNTGEVAVVISQNPARRLRPRLIVLTTPDKALDPRLPELDLMAQPDDRMRGVRRVDIVRALEPGAYGLDPTQLYL